MLLPFVYIVSTTLFGSMITILICRTIWRFTLLFVAGWLLGSIITGTILYFTCRYFTLTFAHSCTVMLFQLGSFSVFAFLLRHRLKFHLRKIGTSRPSLIFSAVIAGLLSLFVTTQAFSNFPAEIPTIARYYFETEFAFISSLLRGCNTPPSIFVDPHFANSTFAHSPRPLLYAASLVSLGSTMAEVFTVLSFLNTISYTVALSYLISQFVRNRPFIITMMGLIGGTPFFDSRRPCLTSLTADLSTHLPVIIQLSFSMEASFSIPLAVFALALAHSISNRQRSARLVIYLSGLAIAFTPSLITVIAFFLSVSINFDFFTGYLPFMLLTFPRLRGAALSFIPVWMEYQQRDVSWPAATAFSNAIGILFLAVPFVFSLRFDAIFFRRIRTAIPTFVLLCALREGQDHFENDIALTGVVWPLLFVVFFALLEKFPKSPLFGLVKWVLIGYALVGGVIWLNTMATTKCPWVDSAALEFGKALDFCLDRKEIVLHNRRSFNPVSILAGRQVLLGNGVQIWRRGGAFHQQADISSLLMGEHNCIHQIMRDYNLSYIVEYRPRPFLLDNLSQWQYFNVIFQNEDWMLLRLDVSMIEQA